jgi:hypothetical protein
MATTAPAFRDTPVRWVRTGPSGHGPSSPYHPGGPRADRWIVRSVTLATTAFALLDLVLLLSHGH